MPSMQARTELYRRQIPVTSGVYLADEKTIVGKPLTVSEDENHVRITGEETEIIFDKKGELNLPDIRQRRFFYDPAEKIILSCPNRY